MLTFNKSYWFNKKILELDGITKRSCYVNERYFNNITNHLIIIFHEPIMNKK